MPIPQVLHSRRQVDKFFIPTHSSRHKLAVTALYRALLTLSKRVPLPLKITHGFNKTWSGDLKPPEQHINPLADLIRRTFKRNKPDVSPRTITPALAAGYRALSLLQDAQTPDSAGSKQVLDVLRQRLAERNRSLATKAKSNAARGIKPGDKPPEKIRYPPLLYNATPEPTPSNPRPEPVFLPSERPRPKSALTGNRVVPHMDLAQGFPFLRIRKPTPHVLSATLQKLINKRTSRVLQVMEFKEVDSADAKLEDAWETALATQAKEEHLPNYGLRNYHRRTEREDEFRKQRDVALAYQDPFASPEAMRARKNHVQMDYHEDAASDLVYYQRADKEISPESGQFATTVWNHGLRYTEGKLSVQQQVNVARAKALRDLISQEWALWQEEKDSSRIKRRAEWEEKMKKEYGEKWQQVVNLQNIQKQEVKRERRAVAKEYFEWKKASKQEFLDRYYEQFPDKMRKFEEDEEKRKTDREKRLKSFGRVGRTSSQLKKEERLMAGEEKKKKVRDRAAEGQGKDQVEMASEMAKVELQAKIEMERRTFEARMVPMGENVPGKENISKLWEERKAEVRKDWERARREKVERGEGKSMTQLSQLDKWEKRDKMVKRKKEEETFIRRLRALRGEKSSPEYARERQTRRRTRVLQKIASMEAEQAERSRQISRLAKYQESRKSLDENSAKQVAKLGSKVLEDFETAEGQLSTAAWKKTATTDLQQGSETERLRRKKAAARRNWRLSGKHLIRLKGRLGRMHVPKGYRMGPREKALVEEAQLKDKVDKPRGEWQAQTAPIQEKIEEQNLERIRVFGQKKAELKSSRFPQERRTQELQELNKLLEERRERQDKEGQDHGIVLGDDPFDKQFNGILLKRKTSNEKDGNKANKLYQRDRKRKTTQQAKQPTPRKKLQSPQISFTPNPAPSRTTKVTSSSISDDGSIVW